MWTLLLYRTMFGTVNWGNLFFKSAKEINPDIVTVAGGPEFPRDESEGIIYLRERNEIDFYVYQEGEVAFFKLIESVLNKCINVLKSKPINGVKFIDSDNNLITGNAHERLKDLDVIPSPYLSGKMEEFFDGSFQPFIRSIGVVHMHVLSVKQHLHGIIK